MPLYFIFVLSFLFLGCTQSPEMPSHEIIAKDKIETNKIEATLAQEEYLKLQKQRAQG